MLRAAATRLDGEDENGENSFRRREDVASNQVRDEAPALVYTNLHPSQSTWTPAAAVFALVVTAATAPATISSLSLQRKIGRKQKSVIRSQYHTRIIDLD